MDATLAEEVSQTRHAREQAERLRADASAQTRRTVRQLRERGMAQRDISALLGISHQAGHGKTSRTTCEFCVDFRSALGGRVRVHQFVGGGERVQLALRDLAG